MQILTVVVDICGKDISCYSMNLKEGFTKVSWEPQHMLLVCDS